MARNKYPEETIEKILDAAYRLFLEKGYEHTTIQDIVDAVGMSKGAVYHHFKSKEDILDKINDRYYVDLEWFWNIRNDSSLNGLEKLRKILLQQLTDSRKLELDHITALLPNNPQLIALTVTASIEDAAPFFAEIIKEGVQDGSLRTESPKELSEVFFLLVNVWIGAYTKTREDFLRKLSFLGEISEKMGMPIIDEAVTATAAAYFNKVMGPAPKKP